MLGKMIAAFKKEAAYEQSTRVELLEKELKELQKELEIKHLNFQNADEKYIDIAINEINLIEQKHSLIFKELKELVS